MRGRPAGFCLGRGHRIVHGNPSFQSSFGPAAVGLPAREALVDLPAAAFELFDVVLAEGRPLAVWLPGEDEDWRLTVAPRVDPETDKVYGVMFHLRARSDVPAASDTQRA